MYADKLLDLLKEAYEAGYTHAAIGTSGPEKGFAEWQHQYSRAIERVEQPIPNGSK